MGHITPTMLLPPLTINVLLPLLYGLTTQDVPDGVNTLLLDYLPASQQPLALVGGNCSIQGFDATGVERHAAILPLSGRGYCTRCLLIAASAQRLRVMRSRRKAGQSQQLWFSATLFPAFVTLDTVCAHKPTGSGRLLGTRSRP